MRMSTPLTRRLGVRSDVYNGIVSRLGSASTAVTRLNLLRLTKLLVDTIHGLSSCWKKSDLRLCISRLADEDPSLLAQNLSKELLKELNDPQHHQGLTRSASVQISRASGRNPSPTLSDRSSRGHRIRLRNRSRSPAYASAEVSE